MRPETLAIHAGRSPRTTGEPLNPPLVPASNFHESGYAREQGSPGWSGERAGRRMAAGAATCGRAADTAVPAGKNEHRAMPR